MLIPTIKIKTGSHTGYMTINESDFVEGMELYSDSNSEIKIEKPKKLTSAEKRKQTLAKKKAAAEAEKKAAAEAELDNELDDDFLAELEG